MKKKSTELQLKDIQIEQKIKIYISDDIKNKIKYLCQKIAKQEWSGILLYTNKGDINKPYEMQITLQDIIPMNKGNSTYTEYSFNEQGEDKHLDYIILNPEAESWHIGHIHSHNTMEAFFSQTDLKELKDNAGAHNFYLSLITNNYLDCVAKIVTKAEVFFTKKCKYKLFNSLGVPYFLEKENSGKEETNVFYDCEVIMNKEETIVSDFFKNSVQDIIDKEKTKEVTTFFSKTQKNNFYGYYEQ
ncbi:MAG: Mov34/MPN/PAD-1 family protein [Fusobacteriaceae bacterium]